jgi:hypothetical protein
MAIVIEESFDFIKNANGELMLVVFEQDKEPVRPRFLFDGEAIATLNRGQGQPVLKLTNLPKEVVDSLNSSKNLSVCEMGKDGSIKFVYEVGVKLISI